MAESSILKDGIYPPLPTFFDEQDELDLVTLRRHIQRLAETGIAGYVVMGTNGEAVHLTTEERAQIIETARDVVGENTPTSCGLWRAIYASNHCQLPAGCTFWSRYGTRIASFLFQRSYGLTHTDCSLSCCCR